MKATPHQISQLNERSILLGFAVQTSSANGKINIRFRWGRLLSAFLGLFVSAWLLAASALFFYFKYAKEYPETTFTGMTILPFRLAEHRKEMGDYHVAKGLAELKEQNYRNALRLLRLGVARAPDNLEGRKVLAEFYEVFIKRPDIAAEMLLGGISKGGVEDADYLKATIKVLLRNQMDAEVQTLADTYLPKEADPTEINSILAFGAANANFLRGNFDKADDYLLEYNLINALDGILLSAQISWERNNKTAAITKLEDALRRYPNSNELLLQLSRYHRKSDNLDEALRYAILRNIISPLSAGPRIELLYNYIATGEEERVKTESAKLLKQFSDDQQALQNLANFAADTGNIEIARRAYEEALEREFGIDSFALLLIEAHLVSGDYEGALSFAEELIKERPDWLASRMAIFNSLRSVASFGINRPDLGEIYLQEFLLQPSNHAETYLAVARRFETIQRPEQARKVLVVAYDKHRTNQRILTDLIRVELELGNTEQLDQLITKLLQMRRPEVELLLEAYSKLGSDRFIFAENRENLLLQLSAILRENAAISARIDS